MKGWPLLMRMCPGDSLCGPARCGCCAPSISVYPMAGIRITWLPTYLREVRHLELGASAVLGGLPLFLGGVGCFFAGMISARVTRRRAASPGPAGSWR